MGSEWRTFSNEKALKDPSRVGDAQNPLLNGGDLTTMIGKVGGGCDQAPRALVQSYYSNQTFVLPGEAAEISAVMTTVTERPSSSSAGNRRG